MGAAHPTALVVWPYPIAYRLGLDLESVPVQYVVAGGKSGARW
jgi:hypothetical protein